LYEYRTKVEIILKIMSEQNVPLIIVPGNNGYAEIIREFAPNAQFYERNSVIEDEKCLIYKNVRRSIYE